MIFCICLFNKINLKPEFQILFIFKGPKKIIRKNVCFND